MPYLQVVALRVNLEVWYFNMLWNERNNICHCYNWNYGYFFLGQSLRIRVHRQQRCLQGM